MDDGGGAGIAGAVLLIAMVLLFLTNAYDSAIRSSRRLREQEEEEGDSRRKRLIRRVLADQSDYVDTIQLITTGCEIALGGSSAHFLYHLIKKFVAGHLAQTPDLALTLLAALLSGLVVILVLVIFAFYIPRRLGSRRPEPWLDHLSGFLLVLIRICRPFVFLSSSVATGVLYVGGVRGPSLRGDVTEEEIRSMVVEGHEQGVIQQTEAEMISNIFEFSDKEAQDIMTRREDIVALDADLTVSEAVAFVLSRHNSRFPVYSTNIDQVLGILHMRDLMRYREAYPDKGDKKLGELKGLIRSAVYVPETKNVDALFRQMQSEKTQIVMVIDEYGQTAGLIAMEDILEEIVGNILDEYDVDESHILPTGNRGEFMLDGRTELEELTKRFSIDFGDTVFETLNGFLTAEMDHIPVEGEHFTMKYGGYRFRVISVADHQVQRVLMTRLEAGREPGTTEEREKE